MQGRLYKLLSDDKSHAWCDGRLWQLTWANNSSKDKHSYSYLTIAIRCHWKTFDGILFKVAYSTSPLSKLIINFVREGNFVLRQFGYAIRETLAFRYKTLSFDTYYQRHIASVITMYPTSIRWTCCKIFLHTWKAYVFIRANIQNPWKKFSHTLVGTSCE